MDIQNLNDIIILLNKSNIIIESLILLQYIIALYLTRTGPVKNGVERGMSWMFGANITYHLAIVAALVAVNLYYSSSLSIEYVIVSFVLSLNRLFLFCANAYLFHMLRAHTRLLDKANIDKEPNDAYTK